MKGFYQIADLEIELEGNTTQLVRAQQAEREFRRACDTLKDVSGADEVLIRTDHVEPKNGGPEFDQIRLRAYRPEESRHYTIDVGTTDNNPFGHYPRTDEGVKVWDWKAEREHVIDPETGEVKGKQQEGGGSSSAGSQSPDSQSAANPNGDPRTSGTRSKHESEQVYQGQQSQAEKPSASEAGETLLRKAKQDTAPDALARDVQVDGTPLPSKIEAFASFAGRDSAYLSRCLDALGVQSASHVAVGELPDLVDMILEEKTLKANESFEPDDDLPF